MASAGNPPKCFTRLSRSSAIAAIGTPSTTIAAAAPAELVVGGVLEGRGGSAELVCARTRLLALSLELELAHLDAGGGGRRFSACFRSFASQSWVTTASECSTTQSSGRTDQHAKRQRRWLTNW